MGYYPAYESILSEFIGCYITPIVHLSDHLSAVKLTAEAGILVVTCGNQIDGSKNVSVIYDYVYDMEKITDIVCKKIGEKGKAVCVVGAPGSAVSDARQKGVDDSVAKYDKVELFVLPAKWGVADGDRLASPDGYDVDRYKQKAME